MYVKQITMPLSIAKAFSNDRETYALTKLIDTANSISSKNDHSYTYGNRKMLLQYYLENLKCRLKTSMN